MKSLFWVFLFVTFLIPQKIPAADMPRGMENELVKVTGAGFIIKTRSPEETQYSLALEIKDTSKLPITVSLEYENPCDKNQPFFSTTNVSPEETKLVLASPAFSFYCLKDNKDYEVKILLTDASDKVLGMLIQRIRAANVSRAVKHMKK